ncbi:DEKNAAC105687 [Brettanomyces naardenensis]|uniref:DEKNAAC105687 n=1 Tax=Brettanomyces naardenensis TaxID=13370 RepID=A0A448YU28_BRENA|nr:DEKNAAC105687 [Brettanomyces naardenensis]
MVLYGINEIIKLTGIEFPASVCLMLIVFFFLSFTSWLKGEEFTQKYILTYIDFPFGFNLRWMNLYFTPPFVTLVLADKVTAKEAFTIAAVFIFGYIVGFAFIGYLVWGLQIVLGTYNHEKETEQSHDQDLELSNIHSQAVGSSDTASVVPAADEDRSSESLSRYELDVTDTNVPQKEEDEGGQLDDGLALSRMATRNADITSLVVQQTHLEFDYVQKLTATFDFIIYFIMFIAGLPIYFCTGYEMVVQLSVAIIMFKACLLPPPKIKKFLHPILVSFSLSLLVYYILSLIKKQNFKNMIQDYETGRTYLNLFDSSQYPRWPGAGDILVSMMDISIASLSLAMYRYRQDLKRYFFALMPVVIVFSFMSFFIYPPLCYHLGISPSRSLGFTGRSVTMALGTPLVHALGGSNQLMAVTTIMSGILGVFLGDWISFTLLRIRRTDFVSRGVTLGVNCGAVSTAHLLSVDPRAAAMSSLSFTLFGTIMVILAAINPLVKIVRGLVGL